MVKPEKTHVFAGGDVRVESNNFCSALKSIIHLLSHSHHVFLQLRKVFMSSLYEWIGHIYGLVEGATCSFVNQTNYALLATSFSCFAVKHVESDENSVLLHYVMIM